MKTNSLAASGHEYGDSLMTVQQFADRYPNIYPKSSRIRWLLRDRQQNGLMSCGAVVEVFANGDKPNLFIHIPSWFAWMQSGGSHAPQIMRAAS
jgi:hypothetical protein